MKSRCCIIPMLLLLALPAPAQTALVEVRVYDHTGLSALSLQTFVKQTQEILSQAGLSIRIDICSTATACEIDGTPARILMLRINHGIPSKMSNLWGSPLGQSFADHTGGTYASLFLEPIQQEAADNDLAWHTVLAYAAAHEVGHLLLGSQAHTQRGLMKARWDKSDFQDMNQNRLHFTGEQNRQLARRCALLSAETERRDEKH